MTDEQIRQAILGANHQTAIMQQLESDFNSRIATVLGNSPRAELSALTHECDECAELVTKEDMLCDDCEASFKNQGEY